MRPDSPHISKEKISEVVDAFYERVRVHPVLSEPFSVVRDWPHHKEIITHFWWVQLGGARYMDYQYHVAPKHREVGFTPELLNGHWLPLFRTTVRETVEAELADIWLEQTERIGRSLHMMHDFWKEKEKESSQ
ncbi:MAG: group III truncated hemoglobin [Formosimonas sp.]